MLEAWAVILHPVDTKGRQCGPGEIAGLYETRRNAEALAGRCALSVGFGLSVQQVRIDASAVERVGEPELVYGAPAYGAAS